MAAVARGEKKGEKDGSCEKNQFSTMRISKLRREVHEQGLDVDQGRCHHCSERISLRKVFVIPWVKNMIICGSGRNNENQFNAMGIGKLHRTYAWIMVGQGKCC